MKGADDLTTEHIGAEDYFWIADKMARIAVSAPYS
jgi:hypothetical protein